MTLIFAPEPERKPRRLSAAFKKRPEKKYVILTSILLLGLLAYWRLEQVPYTPVTKAVIQEVLHL